MRKTKIRLKAERAIKRHASLHEIGLAMNPNYTRPRENALQYLKRTGKHDFWRKGRDALKKKEAERERAREQERQESLRVYISSLEKETEELAQALGPAAQKTREYLREHNPYNKYDFDTLYGIFSRYFESRGNGARPSMEELGKPYSLGTCQIKRILNHVNLEAFHKWTRSRH
jgi:hypothetical protein